MVLSMLNLGIISHERTKIVSWLIILCFFLAFFNKKA